MNRIDDLFKQKQEDVLSVYMTAGYPGLNDTVSVIEALQSSGVDMIEIGMPFSDPLADGPVIQKSSQVALENGMSLKILFEQLRDIRKTVSIPLVLMGYLNPVMQFGFEKFIRLCSEVGIDGLIIPDLPLSEYRFEYKSLCEELGIPLIMLITPQTSAERILEIADETGGFLYVVADSSTTGARTGIKDAQLAYFEKVKALPITIPRLIGFGIGNSETFHTACIYANGAIIGSAFINCLSEARQGELEQAISGFIEKIRMR